MNYFHSSIFRCRRGAVATLILGAFLLTGPVVAQSSGSAAPVAGNNVGVDEHSRIMQAYMAKRAEWIELREVERKRANAAKDVTQRQNILRQLDEVERVLRSEAADLARQLKASAKKKQDDAKPRG